MNSKHFYIVGICGTGTGALAGLLQAQGHRVSGSDATIYPPMSDKLVEWGINLFEGYDAAHLDGKTAYDYIIIGNVIRRDNVEAVAALALGLPILSMPQAVAQFGIEKRHSICVAGTHGKTTTTALIAHTALEAGVDPSFLVGGALVGYRDSFRLGQGDLFVVEGDEYDTAFFDKGPKFLHYRAQTAIITSLEFDHADIFKDIAAVEAVFTKLIKQIPESGHLVVWQGATRARRLIDENSQVKRVTYYGTHSEAASAKDSGTTQAVLLRASHARTGPQGLSFEATLGSQSLGSFLVPLWGDFSVQNALAALAALMGAGLDVDAIRHGFNTFRGVKRRMEVVYDRRVCVVDDFAHHPTAVFETLKAARARFNGRRIWAIFEPRSATSRRNVFHDQYLRAFSIADRVIIAGHARLAEVPQEDRFSPETLAQELNESGTWARAIMQPAAIATLVAGAAKPGDVIMILSNGDFGGLQKNLIGRLR